MKKGRSHQDYLTDMLDAMSKARQFVEGMSFEQFSADDKTVFAVIRALEIVPPLEEGIRSLLEEDS